MVPIYLATRESCETHPCTKLEQNIFFINFIFNFSCAGCLIGSKVGSPIKSKLRKKLARDFFFVKFGHRETLLTCSFCLIITFLAIAGKPAVKQYNCDLLHTQSRLRGFQLRFIQSRETQLELLSVSCAGTM